MYRFLTTLKTFFCITHEQAAKATLIACSTAFAIVFVLIAFPLCFDLFYCGTDLTRIDLGLACAIKRQIAEGSGLWLSPFLGNGAPLLLRPVAQLLYPPRLFLLLFSPEWATSLGPALHLALGAFGTTWLVRTFGIRPFFSVCAGLCFAFSGTALDLILHSNYIVAGAWLPFVWASTRSCLSVRHRWWHPVALAGTLSLLLLGGEPQAFCIGAALVCFETLVTWYKRKKYSLAKANALAVAVVILVVAAFLIGLLQWGGTLAEFELTDRKGSLNIHEALGWSFIPVTWPAVLLPGYVHEAVWPLTNVWSIWNNEVGPPFPWNRSPYLGSLLLVSVVCGFAATKTRRAGVVCLVGLIFALGECTPVLPLLLKMFPPLSLFRYPAKYLVVTVLASVVLAAGFFEQLSRRHALHGVTKRTFFWVGGILAGAHVIFLCTLPYVSDQLNQLAALMGTGHVVESLPMFSEMLNAATLHSLVPLGIALFVLKFVARFRSWVFVFAVMDLVLAIPSHVCLGPSLKDLSSPWVALRQHDADVPVVCTDPDLTKGMFQRSDIYSPWGTYAFVRSIPAAEVHACDGLSNPVVYSPLQTSMNGHLVTGLSKGRASAARALGCTHLVTKVPIVDGGARPLAQTLPGQSKYQELYQAKVLEIIDPLPKIMVSKNPVLATSDLQVIQALGKSMDAQSAMAVIDDPLGNLPPDAILPNGTSATVVGYQWHQQHTATVTLAGIGGAVIGLKTSFQKGWHALQGDKDLPMVRLSGQHIAAVVQNVTLGDIRFVYRMPRATLGLVSASVGLLLVMVLAWFYKRKVFVS